MDDFKAKCFELLRSKLYITPDWVQQFEVYCSQDIKVDWSWLSQMITDDHDLCNRTISAQHYYDDSAELALLVADAIRSIVADKPYLLGSGASDVLTREVHMLCHLPQYKLMLGYFGLPGDECYVPTFHEIHNDGYSRGGTLNFNPVRLFFSRMNAFSAWPYDYTLLVGALLP